MSKLSIIFLVLAIGYVVKAQLPPNWGIESGPHFPTAEPPPSLLEEDLPSEGAGIRRPHSPSHSGRPIRPSRRSTTPKTLTTAPGNERA